MKNDNSSKPQYEKPAPILNSVNINAGFVRSANGEGRNVRVAFLDFYPIQVIPETIECSHAQLLQGFFNITE